MTTNGRQASANPHRHFLLGELLHRRVLEGGLNLANRVRVGELMRIGRKTQGLDALQLLAPLLQQLVFTRQLPLPFAPLICCHPERARSS